ncbi:MAG: imidazoleglycerol-phosphate dehydratase HisB [Candidatus Aureabacteria bacterium]|nr:imidazoleglycerol-phosphate dehydratase HisB [Candidatus Auribacterota bacterium]
MKARKSAINRKTRETDIRLKLNLDGTGVSRVCTGIGIFDHMLELFSKHSRINLDVTAKGDLRVDDHHTVEDIGICIGEALREALGSKAGIDRYGFCMLPMDEALVSVAMDLSGRAHLRYDVKTGRQKIGGFDLQLIEEFFQALVGAARITLHVQLICGKNPHHIIEAVFKAVARALGMAVRRARGGRGIPSTKGKL